MSARQYFVHDRTGDRYVFVGLAPRAGVVVLQRVEHPDDAVETCYWIVPADLFLTDFTRVPDAADEPIPFTVPGVQPRSEFTAGPTGNGPQFSDEYLATLVGRWSRQQAGGAS